MRPGDVRGRRGPEERVQECGSTHIYRDESVCVCVCAGGRIAQDMEVEEAQSAATGGKKTKD